MSAHPVKATLANLSLLLGPALLPAAAQTLPPLPTSSATAPATYHGAPPNGWAVDISDGRLMFLGLDAAIYDVVDQVYLETQLLTDAGINFSVTYDIAIEGDLAAVAYDEKVAVFEFTGPGWTLVTDAASTATAEEGSQIEIHDGVLYTLQRNGVLGVDHFTLLSQAWDGNDLTLLASYSEPESVPIRLAVGDGPSGPQVVVVVLPAGSVNKDVLLFEGTAFSNRTFVGADGITTGFGNALAVDGDFIFVGLPGNGLSDPGSVKVFRRPSASLPFELHTSLENDGADGFGRALAVDGPILAVGARTTDFLPVNPDAGAVHIFRRIPDEAGGLTYEASGEVLHGIGPDLTTPDDYGAAVALDGEKLYVGAPGAAGGGQTKLSFLALDSTIGNDLSPALAGVGGVEPVGEAAGFTSDGSPCRIRLAEALPGAPAWLLLGDLAIDAPFKFGVMHPVPLVILGLVLDATGGLEIPFTWVDLPPGATLVGQFWIADPEGPAGFASTAGFHFRQDG